MFYMRRESYERARRCRCCQRCEEGGVLACRVRAGQRGNALCAHEEARDIITALPRGTRYEPTIRRRRHYHALRHHAMPTATLPFFHFPSRSRQRPHHQCSLETMVYCLMLRNMVMRCATERARRFRSAAADHTAYTTTRLWSFRCQMATVSRGIIHVRRRGYVNGVLFMCPRCCP